MGRKPDWTTREQAQRAYYVAPSVKKPQDDYNPNCPDIPWRVLVQDLNNKGLSTSMIAKHCGINRHVLYDRQSKDLWPRFPRLPAALRLLGLHRALIGSPDYLNDLLTYCCDVSFDA